ncbi:MAG: ANTAR domain-containing protein [Lachnospiraceae bacterium]|nr:ANTAR domain-containing protein [Lachnospiraceae bacterium]
MALSRHIYSVLLVSAAKKVNTELMPLFSRDRFESVTVVDTVAKAQRKIVDMDYDLVVINSPLPDDFGKKFAVDVSKDSDKVALLIVRSDLYDEISFSMMPHGVMVSKRPIDNLVMEQLFDAMCSVREKLRGIRKKTVSLEDKMEEIRLVNRAKWALIKSCHMTEEDAHRYIQKQAMDMCISKKETAENILKTYS